MKYLFTFVTKPGVMPAARTVAKVIDYDKVMTAPQVADHAVKLALMQLNSNARLMKERGRPFVAGSLQLADYHKSKSWEPSTDEPDAAERARMKASGAQES